MKKNILIMTLTAGTLLTAGCSTDKETTEDLGRVPVNLSCVTVQATDTRAANDLNETQLTSGNVKVNMKKHSEVWNAANALDYTAGAGGTLTAVADKFFYDNDGSTVDIIAYYPSTAGTSFSVLADQSADDNYKGSDLMWAEPVVNQSRTTAAVTLKMNHKMAKISVKATAGVGISQSQITAIKLKQVKPTVTFDQTTGAVGAADGTATDILVASDPSIGLSGSANYAAVIPAQTIDGAFLEITADGQTATYAVNSKSFEAGRAYTLDITVNSAALGLTNAITDWNDDSPITDATGGPTTLAELAEWIKSSQPYSKYLGWYVKVDGSISPTSTDAIGRIAYMDKDNDVEISVSGSNILVLAVENVSSYMYKTSGTAGESDYNSTERMDGLAFCVNHNSETYPAAYYCYNWTASRPSGTTNWFLPSYAQWDKMKDVGKMAGTGQITGTGAYRCTTECASDATKAWYLRVGSSTWEEQVKNTSTYTRACFAYSPSCLPMQAVTSAHIGWVITSDGLVYPNVGAAEAAGKTASGMIAYVGNKNNVNGNDAYSATYNHGLAIALTDVNSTTGTEGYSVSLTWSNATTACSAYVRPRPSASSGWMMPSAYQLQRMLIGCGSSASYIAYSSQSFTGTTFDSSDFCTKLIFCGGDGISSNSAYYWLNTDVSTNPSSAWLYIFGSSTFNNNGKAAEYRARPCFAF